MSLKKKEKLKVIKQYATQITDIKRTWFCDEHDKTYEPRHYYPGGRVGYDELLAEYSFSKPKCMYYKGQVLDFTRISFFADRIQINDCNYYDKWIYDCDYGDLYSIGNFPSLALIELFRKLDRNIDNEPELYAFDVIDCESISNRFNYKIKRFNKELEDIRKQVEHIIKQDGEGVWKQRDILEPLLDKLYFADDVFTGPYT